MDEPMNVGCDVGMGAIKLYGPAGGLQMLSQVALDGSARLAALAGLSTRKPPLRISYEGRAFYVDAGAHDAGRPVESLDYERLTGAPEMIALWRGALTRYAQRFGPIVAPLRLTVGLPTETLTGDEAIANIAAVNRWLKGTHTWRADDQEYSVHVSEVKITSQAAAACFDFLLDEQGQFVAERKAYFKQEIGVISLGFNTLELLLVRDKAAVQRFTAGATVGVRRLLEIVNSERLYSLGELDTLLRAGRLEVASALPIWEREVTGVIENRWGNLWRRFAVIVLVGGGAILLRESLPYRFNGKAVVPDDPVMALARGLYKLSVFQNRKKTA